MELVRTIEIISNEIVADVDLMTGSEAATQSRVGIVDTSVDTYESSVWQGKGEGKRSYTPILMPCPKIPSAWSLFTP